MKKIFLVLLLIPFALHAKSFLISNIPLPKTYIQNLDPYPCDDMCLKIYLNNGMIFSFLAHADTKLQNKRLDEIRLLNMSILNVSSQIPAHKIKIALLLPNKIIGRYAASITNASFAYLLSKNQSFELKSYNVTTENIDDLQDALKKIKKDKFSYVIAPLTQKGVNSIIEIDPNLNIFIPTINKKDVESNSKNIYFGGIDYRAQSDELLKKAVSPLIIFHDKSSIGNKLSLYEAQKFKELQEQNSNAIDTNATVIKYSIPKRTTNLEKQLKENEEIQNGSFFINTPIVKTGMIMSQLTLYDANATNILSTQINYDPLLLSMTQYEDRKHMLIANSITQNNNIFIESNALLGNDIVYDWINYTTTIGIDYFFSIITNHQREYKIPLKDNQVIYPIKLVKPSVYKFITLE